MRRLLFVMPGFLAACFLPCSLAWAGGLPPEVTTQPAAVVGVGQVMLNGTVGANDGATSVTIEYGPSTEYGFNAAVTPSGLDAYNVKTVSAVVSGLDPTTTYHYRVNATSVFGTTNGQDMTVTPGVPAAVTNAAVVTGHGAVSLNGSVNGWGSSTAVSFEFGLTTSYGSSISASPSNVGATTPTAVTASVSGLNVSSVYHCRVKAVGRLGTVYGDDVTVLPAQPTVITLVATSISSGQATLQGTVKGNGLSSTVSFEYGPTTSYGSVAAAAPGSSATDQPTTAVSVALSGLTTTVTYHYRVKAVTSAGTSYGQDMTVTPKAGAPAATTLAATAVSNTGGTLQGLVNANGSSTTVTFQYGTSTSYGSTAGGTPSPVTGTSDKAVTAVTSSFSPGTVIHYRVVASNASGTTFGADMTFTTTPNPPSFVTGFADSITASSALLYANVATSGGSSTVVTFEYGLTTDYGASTPAWQNAGGANGSTVNGQISGLAGGTTYHYRVRAVNAGGTITSHDNTLTTAAAVTGAPTLTTQASLPVNSTQATLNGIVNGNGSTTTVFFDFGTTTQYTASLFVTTLANNVTDTAVTADVSNLTAGTTYHCRVRATDGSGGFIYGADVSFTAAAASGVPVAATAPATLLTAGLERLNGYVSANGGAAVTSAAFEYGTDTSYGSTAFVGGGIVGTGFQAVSAVVPFFDTSVTYHYRLRASTASTTVYGEDMTFVTPDPHSAALGSLVLRGVTLQPGFATGTTSYSASVPYDTNTVQITPTAAQRLARVMVNEFVINPGGSFITLPLNLGDNTINVVVTAMDGTTTQTYTVVVTRGQPRAGNLDFTFGSDSGKTRISVGSGNDFGTRLLQQPDGKLLLAGYAVNSGSSDVALIRMLPDGSLDAAFNGTGVVTTDNGGQGDYGKALALQPDGKILVAGFTNNGTNNDLLLLRYNGDGTLDSSFNGTGMVVTALSSGDDMAAGVAVQSDGGIVVAGTTWNGTDNDFAVVRYTSAGLLDTSFNSTGKVVTDFGGHLNETASDMALQSGGRIVVAGTSGFGGAGVACYTNAGVLDAGFNGTGLVTTSNDMSVQAVALQSDGKVVVAGSSYNGGDSDFTLLRYTSAGALDTSFNGTGTVTTDFGARGYDDPGGLVIQNDGRIVVAGRSSTAGGVVTFSMARYDSLGVLDGSFGSGGLVNLSFGSFEQGAAAVALQDDGKIVAAGYTGVSTNQTFAVARFLGDGPGMAVTQQSNGVKIFDGLSSADIGQALAGATVSQTFFLKNSGLADLSGFGLTVTGANAGDFTAVTTPAAPAPPLSTTQSMILQVSFTPSSVGAKTAVLHIASNVAGNNGSFDIALTGSGLTDSQNWRLTWFGITDASGGAADNADPDSDGLPNLIEYALE